MILAELIEFLKQGSFQDTEAGLLSFPAYVYTYEPAKEYQMRKEIPTMQKRLERPKSKQECLVLNIYSEIIAYFDGREMGDNTLWELMLNKEEKEPKKVRKDLSRHLTSDNFIDHINDKINDHLQYDSGKNKSYVFVHGWGSVFPFLRAHTFLNNMEDKVKHYKMILLYPGFYKDNYYSMFGELENNVIYRASCLNQLIGE